MSGAGRTAATMDWRSALRAALRLGLTPEDFWRLSLVEWRALTGGAAGLSRSELLALLERFPDEGR